MDHSEAIAKIKGAGVPAQEAPHALIEAADAARYYAHRGEWPKLVSTRAWAAIRVVPLSYLAMISDFGRRTKR